MYTRAMDPSYVNTNQYHASGLSVPIVTSVLTVLPLREMKNLKSLRSGSELKSSILPTLSNPVPNGPAVIEVSAKMLLKLVPVLGCTASNLTQYIHVVADPCPFIATVLSSE